MSTNVYGPQNGPAPDFLRNTYDKQFQNLITTNFGELRPCFCKEVLPGDSINIDPVVAIRSQPIIFPIQTRMKFYCHFFYGRNRILYKDWEDFIFQTKDGLTPPLLRLTEERAKKMISTGSLGDNLGVVSTYASDVVIDVTLSVESTRAYSPYREYMTIENSLSNTISSFAYIINNNITLEDFNNLYTWWYITAFSSLTVVPSSKNFVSPSFISTASSFEPSDSCFLFVGSVLSNTTLKILSLPVDCVVYPISEGGSNYHLEYRISDEDFLHIQGAIASAIEQYGSCNLCLGTYDSVPHNDKYVAASNTFVKPMPSSSDFVEPLTMVLVSEGVTDATADNVISSNKFVGDSPTIPLSALPFRLYEFICNYYYRNDTNNPYVLNGEPQYNCFIPTTDGDWDTNEYLIHHRNWESDMFTTCVPSPQFGTAPLVGLSYNGGLTADVTTSVTDSDGNTQNLSIKVGVDDDGNISNIFNADTGVPSGSLKALMDAMSTTGISINTLRNVNSFQRFLENVIRRGLRYRNQLLSHFGVSVDYPDIDIPQFIGGFSGDLVVREVTNMVETSNVALGDVAGKIDAVIQSNHSINCYCAEHGFIMGIFSIVPVPTYSQVLPHMFTRYSPFDYFQKEFDKIGYVPVTYRNFLPLQADNPDETFGYQRAHYEYMSSLDEVHGDFRMSLDDFVLYRIFKQKPTLNANFLQVYHDSLNNIFAVDNVEGKYKDADKFLLQFYFQYTQKTMIPKHGVASLE